MIEGATVGRPRILITDDGLLTEFWAFLRERLEERLAPTCDLLYIDVRTNSLADVEWSEIDAVALFGGNFTESMLDRATSLRVVASETDTCGIPIIDKLFERGIPFIEGTPGWGQSVAECALALIICGLRRIPQWHHKVIDGFRPWTYPFVQFSDDPNFVNGTIAGKTVGILGLGEIGGRLALWCEALGATVLAYDPYCAKERFKACKAQETALDELLPRSDIFVVATPDTPTVNCLVDRGRIYSLRRGTLVVTVTRAAALDADALRERVLGDELAWAADVFDVEPLPEDDPIIGRHNCVHIPHIAGRTKNANHAVADILADDILRVLSGKAARNALTAQRLHVRTGR